MSLQLHTSSASPAYRDHAADLAALAPSPAAATPPPPLAAFRMEPSYHPQLAALTGQGGALSRTPDGAAAVDFSAEVAGQQPLAIDLSLMEVSAAVYDPSITRVGDLTRVGDDALLAVGIDPAALENADTGFRAGIYTDGEGRHVLAFAGSNETRDWTGANLRQGLGWQAEQFDQAVQLAQLADVAYGDGLVVTGHSLGGGLAATASLAIGNTAVTFNASGVHDDTMRSLGLNPAAAKAVAADGQIRRYSVDGEALTRAQEDIWVVNGIPDAPGHAIRLDDPAPLTGWDRFNPVAIVRHAGELHLQDAVLDALGQQRPWE